MPHPVVIDLIDARL